jgi:hypothetical protein
MKKDILKNNANPFTVPDGYFDSLQKRIMSRVQAEENRTEAKKGRTVRMNPYRTMVAAAACILFIFTGAVLYMTHTGEQAVVAETAVDEDFYQWFYASDRTALMAESLNINMPEDVTTGEAGYSEEDEAIIRFLECNNINVVAIVHSLDTSYE